ncbi:MAG: hypothetical protein ACRYFS_24005 [Janthinobacterium lividum]
MLKHEDTLQAQSQSAAKVRVTPEELAAAITRIEARKDASQRNLEGTVAIGEVVQQLGLDATPDELLAEVQAGRQHTKPEKKRASTARKIVTSLGLAGIIFGSTISILRLHDGSDMRQQASSMTPIPITADPSLTVGDASGKILMLTEVGDNQPVRCAFDNQSSTLQDYSPNSPAVWRLVKHDGKVYVRGWMVNASPKVMAENGIDIANENNPGFNIPVTLPLDSFKVMPFASFNASFHAVDIHLDKHAYEKW